MNVIAQSLPRVLIADEDLGFAHSFQESLTAWGVPAVLAKTAQEADAAVRHNPSLCLAFVDSQIPALGGLGLMQQLRHVDPNLTAILTSAGGTLAAALEATKRGAADYLLKPFNLEAMAERVSRFQELFQVDSEDSEALAVTGPIRRLEDFIYRSSAMRGVLEGARSASPSEASVLLVGERGVGKDMLARAIHSASPRASGPFFRIDCSTDLPDPNLRDPAASEEGLRRLFEATAAGTLFLNEVGDLPAHIQERLANILAASRSVHPIDGTQVKSGPRIIASSRHSIVELQADRLQVEIFSRVAEVVLEVPPLRRRPEDIPPLVRYFLGRLGRRFNHQFVLTWSGLDLLLRYALPGNVRELECILERVAARTLQIPRSVTYGDLRPYLEETGIPPKKLSLDEQPLDLNHVEQLAIERALWFAKGNRTKAAALLGIDRTTLHSKLRRFSKETATN
jgi:two-component system response regulator HydG